jgi:hypothetical protein
MVTRTTTHEGSADNLLKYHAEYLLVIVSMAQS